ncbi:PAS domain S-box protein, partial [bacterium]|nr:PAS domain S-box protein [bacterium]
TRSELIGDHFSKGLTPQAAAEAKERHRRAQAGEKLSSIFESEFMRNDGAIISVECRARFIRDTSGKITGFQGSYRDITERKQTEARLRASEERFRAAAQGSLDAFMILESVRNEAGEIERLPRQFRVLEIRDGVVGPYDTRHGADGIGHKCHPGGHAGSFQPVRASNTFGVDHSPRFSPDGQWVVFAAQTLSFRNEIFVRHLASGTEHQLTTNRVGDFEPYWAAAPDPV